MKNKIKVHVTQDSSGRFIATAKRGGMGVSYDGEVFEGVEDECVRKVAAEAYWDAVAEQEEKDFDISDQSELIEAFWSENPQWEKFMGRKQNCCPCDVRMAWCDFIESKHRSGEISDRLVNSAVLE